MTDIKKYSLEFNSTKNFVMNKIGDVNTLSKYICKLINFDIGHFYTFLPKTKDVSEAIDSLEGTRANLTPKKVFYSFVLDTLNKKTNKICVFDDFHGRYTSNYDEGLYLSHGRHLSDEIYYVFTKKNATFESIQKAFRYNDLIWHSLAVITSCIVEETADKTLSVNDCINICKNAEIILVTAFDAEGYIIWEKDPKNIVSI
ncbi:MAG: hypothetical protein S4CHLAM7_07960 [Chlamydiae bacterium]|nr:hypothetical protein [Chlamydiota bacterium]